MIRTEAWSFYRTISGVRLCWELEELKGPKGCKVTLRKVTLLKSRNRRLYSLLGVLAGLALCKSLPATRPSPATFGDLSPDLGDQSLSPDCGDVEMAVVGNTPAQTQQQSVSYERGTPAGAGFAVLP